MSNQRVLSVPLRAAILALIIAAIVTLDQVTKSVVRATLPLNHVYSVVGNVLIMVHVENSGAFLSLGAAWGGAVRTVVFTLFTAGVLVALVVYLLRSKSVGIVPLVSLAAVAGGGIGNLIDRFGRHGHVTDFLNVGIGGLRTGIFNAADFFILFGVIAFFIASLVTPAADRTLTK